MKNCLSAIAVWLCVFALSGSALSAPLSIHATEVTTDRMTAGAPLGSSLRNLLISRIDRNSARFVDLPEQADIIMNSSFSTFGALFSWDVLLKNRKSGIITSVFEQGTQSDDILPAAGRLAGKINKEIADMISADAASVPVIAEPVSSTITAVTPASASADLKVAKPAAESYAIRTEAKTGQSAWNSESIEGVFIGMALGRRIATGERELFLAGERIIRFYLKGTELKLLAETEVPISSRILAIDAADLNHDGITEVYATIIDRNVVSSRVYRVEGTSLHVMAENLPWFFRGVGTDLKSRKILAQELGVKGGFAAEVHELGYDGQRFEAASRVLLPPRSGSIFNSQRIRDSKGNDTYVTINPDGYLIVVSIDGEEVWKSADKFGGSEMRFKDSRLPAARSVRDMDPWIFMEQRITLLPDGTLLVPGNEGTFSVGNNRNYNRHAMFAYRWNGAQLNEIWHSRQTPGYLADYAYEPDSRELVLLEIVKKEGLFGKGRSVISTNRID